MPVFVRSLDELMGVVSAAPKVQARAGSSLLVTFLPISSKLTLGLPAIIPRSTAKIISMKGAEVYSETHGGGEGGLPNQFLESKLSVKTTTRNMNVVRQIVDRYG